MSGKAGSNFFGRFSLHPGYIQISHPSKKSYLSQFRKIKKALFWSAFLRRMDLMLYIKFGCTVLINQRNGGLANKMVSLR
jgi:hypothetical protein